MIIGRHDAAGHPAAIALMQTVARSIDRPDQARFWRRFSDAISEVRITSPYGEQRFALPEYHVDAIRLRRVAARIVRGLVWHETQRPWDDTLEVIVYPDDHFVPRDEAAANFMNSFIQKMVAVPPVSIGDDIFRYWKGRVSEDSHLSSWILQFYRGPTFVALVMPKDRPHDISTPVELPDRG